MTNLNIKPTTLGKAKPVIIACIKLHQAVILHGKPGIGKTQMIEEIADEFNEELGGVSFRDKEPEFNLISLRLSQFPPEDLAGLPVPVEKKLKNGDIKYITYRSLPDFLPRDKKSKGILFLDEINQANSSVLHAVFELILDRRITACNYSLPKGWSIVAACNDYEDNPEITEFSRPLNNRFLHLNIVQDVKEWLIWAKKNSIHPNIIKFVDDNRGVFNDINPKNVCFCSPRTLAQVSNFEFMFDKGDINCADISLVVHGLLGKEIGENYLSSTAMARSGVLKDLDIKKYLRGDLEYDLTTIDVESVGLKVLEKAFFIALLSLPDNSKKGNFESALPKYFESLHTFGSTDETITAQINEMFNDGMTLSEFKDSFTEAYGKLIELYPTLAV